MTDEPPDNVLAAVRQLVRETESVVHHAEHGQPGAAASRLHPCLSANSTGVNMVVSMPALGAGNTNASVSAWGFLK